jgi:hypothetical protein
MRAGGRRAMRDRKHEVAWSVRRELLPQLRFDHGLDADELSLFEWYSRENSKVIEQMLSTEHAYLQEQLGKGVDEPNDSGFVAVDYYIKRVRYSDVIYMASLLEMYLERACKKLRLSIGDQSVPFDPEELVGDKWTKRKKFLERYGRFEFPEGVWSELRTLILVRNNLVHDNGDASQLSVEEKSQVQTRPGIKANQYELVIDEEYLIHYLSSFRSLVQFIGERLNKVIDRAQRPQTV